jgi:hypothetical protein
MMKLRNARSMAVIALLAGMVFLIYIAVAGLSPIGRQLLVLAVVRLAVVAGLSAFAAIFGLSGRLARFGMRLTIFAAVLYFVAVVGIILIAGWSLNVLADPNTPAWMPISLLIASLLSLIGPVLVGIAAFGIPVPRLAAIAILLAGLFQVVPFFLDTKGVGYAVWTLPWLAIAAYALTATRDSSGSVP